MKNLILIAIAILTAALCKADTLLIPEQGVSFTNYREACQKNSYICTDKYFLDLYTQKETPQFDELINSIDLSSKEFIKRFTKDISNVLQNEMISEDQLEMALRLVTQVNELTENRNQLALVEKELKKFKEALSKSNDQTDVENFIILFKKRISEVEYKSLKLSLLKVPTVYIHYASVPQEKNTRLNFASTNEPLLVGQCDKAQLSKNIQLQKWQAVPAETCFFASEFTSVGKSVTQSISDNKKWYITGALVIGAAILLNQYEVKFQF